LIEDTYDLVKADFNGDRRPDLAVAGLLDTDGPDGVLVLLGRGDGRFDEREFSTEEQPFSIATGDFNQDKRPDLAISMFDSAPILFGNGDGTFTLRGEGLRRADGLAVGDLDRDGRADLVGVNSAAKAVMVALGRGNGTFKATRSFPTGGDSPTQSLIADFNRDHRRDLAVANYDSKTMAILLGRGDGTFGAPRSFPTRGDGPFRAVAKDFNWDGRLDLAVGNFLSGTIAVLLGRGDGAFARARLFPATEPVRTGSARALAVGDVNRDGCPDLVTGGDGDQISVLLNRCKY
jgi:hypothetical protein